MIVVVSTDSKFPGHAYRVAAAVHGGATGHFGSKVIIVVDGDIAADDLAGVWFSIGCRYDPKADTQIYHKIRQTPFDPALPLDGKDFGSGIVIDATTPVEWGDKAPVKVELDPDITAQCAGKWLEYGFEEPY
jgi:4-hydroxy-3-polyprenylbenzoate decarboxylase